MMLLPLPAQSRFVRTLVEPDDEGIARHHAFDIERTGLRVAAAGARFARFVAPAGIDGPRPHRVAWIECATPA